MSTDQDTMNMDALAEELSNVEENEQEHQESISQLAHEESDAEDDQSAEEEVPEFKQEYHVKYFKRCLQGLPYQYTSLDSNRLTLAYFCVSGLDVLGALDDIIPDKSGYIDWIYSHQILPDEHTDPSACGFRGGTYCGNEFNPEGSGSCNVYDLGHITMTYAALVTLKTLGDDLSRVNTEAVVASLKALQQEDGSFSPVIGGSESDMRFLFCACAVSYLLDDWSGVDTDLALSYIVNSQTYEGAIAQGPNQEAHGGSTYCGLAALKLMDKLDQLPNQDLLLRWLVNRQITGFQGRINKIPDTCYSWWIGGSLSILDKLDLLDIPRLQSYSLRAQFVVGGVRKWPDPELHPDILHSYLAICGFALQGAFNLTPIIPELNITKRSMGVE